MDVVHGKFGGHWKFPKEEIKMNELMLLWAAIKWIAEFLLVSTVVFALVWGMVLMLWMSIRLIAESLTNK